MSILTIALPESLEAALAERAKEAGVQSKEEYLVALVEADCGGQELDRVLGERSGGTFEVMEVDWKERVRAYAASRARE